MAANHWYIRCFLGISPYSILAFAAADDRSYNIDASLNWASSRKEGTDRANGLKADNGLESDITIGQEEV